MNEIIRDGGVKSRKLWFSLFAIAVIFTGGVLAGSKPGIAAIYSTMVGGILGVVAAYLTGNVTQKWVGTKAPMEMPGGKTEQPAAKEEPAKPPEARFSEDE